MGGYGNKKYSLTKQRKKRKAEMKGSESQKENAVETKRRREWNFKISSQRGEPPRNKQVRGISEATRPVLPQTSLVLKAVRLGPDLHFSGSGNLWPNCSLVGRVWIQRPHLPFLSHLRAGWRIVG